MMLCFHISALLPFQLFMLGFYLYRRNAEYSEQVKSFNRKFCGEIFHFIQVNSDQGQERINRKRTKGRGIISITKTTSTLTKSTISYNFRLQVSVNTHNIYNINTSEKNLHNENNESRQAHAHEETKLMALLQKLNVFAFAPPIEALQSIAQKNQAINEFKICYCMLLAKKSSICR